MTYSLGEAERAVIPTAAGGNEKWYNSYGESGSIQQNLHMHLAFQLFSRNLVIPLLGTCQRFTGKKIRKYECSIGLSKRLGSPSAED